VVGNRSYHNKVTKTSLREDPKHSPSGRRQYAAVLCLDPQFRRVTFLKYPVWIPICVAWSIGNLQIDRYRTRVTDLTVEGSIKSGGPRVTVPTNKPNHSLAICWAD